MVTAGPRRRPGRSRAVLLAAGAACVAALLSDCGGAGPARPSIMLLPASAPDPHGQAWQWTSRCQFGPATSAGCQADGPHLGAVQLAGDEWNLGASGGASGSAGAGAGSVAMSVDAGGVLTVDGRLPSAPPCTAASCIAPMANTWVRGYPSVSYGVDQCRAASSPPASSRLRLPTRVGAIPPDLVGVTSYSADTAAVTDDIAYDLWLNDSATGAPCRTDGTVEVMVWTGYDAEALLPATMRVATATVPFSVDGSARTGRQAWSVYTSNVQRGGHTAPWGGTVWLVLDGPDAVRSGTVEVDISAALAAVGSVLEGTFGWADFERTYWLDTIAFGLEYGPAGAQVYGSGSTDFSFALKAYCLDVRSTVATAAC